MNELAQFFSEKYGVPIDSVFKDIEGFISRFVTYKIVSNIVGAVTCLILFIIFAWILKNFIVGMYKEDNNIKASSKFEESVMQFYDNSDELTLCLSLLCIILCFDGLLAGTICNIISAIKWGVVPEIQMLEYMQCMMASGS